jgi:UDP-glucose 4-epimerase
LLFIVTGAAGFIGSTLTDRLLVDGNQVIGIDCFRDYYSPTLKQRNLADALGSGAFELITMDLSSDPLGVLTPKVKGTKFRVFHLAAQAGVRKSWGQSFGVYTRDNILATQRLLEWARERGTLDNFIYGSSSSVYGNARELPMDEDTTLPCPYSPYGVTKLAAENLVRLYGTNYYVPSVSLRFFTVYGPRQRPDMAFHRFIHHALRDEPIEIYGDGSQTRDFTYVDDVVEGLLALSEHREGGIYNLGGGHRVTLAQAVDTLEAVMLREIKVDYQPSQMGDVTDTWASTDKIEKATSWKPSTSLSVGLGAEVDWMRQFIHG